MVTGSFKKIDYTIAFIHALTEMDLQNDAIDLIFGSINSYLVADNYEAVDYFLDTVEFNRLSTTLLLSCLTICVAAKDKLKNWSRSLEQIKTIIINRHGTNKSEKLLEGFV